MGLEPRLGIRHAQFGPMQCGFRSLGPRREYHRRRIERRIFGGRTGTRADVPRPLIVLGRRRQMAMGEFDLPPPVGRRPPGRRIVPAGPIRPISRAAAIDYPAAMAGTIQPPIAVDRGAADIDAIDDDRHARFAGNHDDRLMIGPRRDSVDGG